MPLPTFVIYLILCLSNSWVDWSFVKCPRYKSLTTAVPNLFGTRDQFRGRQFFHGLGEGGNGFGMIQGHYIYCVLYFCCYYIVIHNEIIIQLTIRQNQWEPWACFPATRWSHLGVMGDSDTRSVLLMSSLLYKMQLKCHLPLTDTVLIWVCKQLIYYGLCEIKPLC